MDKPIAWYDPTNGAVSTDKNSPLFTPLGQVWPLYTKQEQEPFEYWNAVEGWVKIEEVREHFDSVGCGTIYKTAGEGREPLYTTPPQRTVQEPVAIYRAGQTKGEVYHVQFLKEMAADEVLLYDAPVQRTWVGLTKEERHKISLANKPYVADIMAAHEEELKRRNT